MAAEVPVGFHLEYIFKHVFLPPKLPGSCDRTVEAEVGLTMQFHDALKTFTGLLREVDQKQWIKLPLMLSVLLDDGNLGSPLENIDRKLGDMAEGDVLAIHLTSQNAGLVIRKQGQAYVFESFELSALSKVVTGTTGRLIRKFPGAAIAISNARFRDRSFAETLTQCLVTLERETLDDSIGEDCSPHEAADPKFATEWLPGMLRGIGSPQDITPIYKRDRDDVIGGDGHAPWRRSRRWLLLRVALQSTIAGLGGDHTRYKVFMIFFMASLLEQAVEPRKERKEQHREQSSDMLHVMLAKINRRIQKLELNASDDILWAEPVLDFVMEVMEFAHSVLTKRWSTIQKSANSAGTFHLTKLKKLDPRSDTISQIPHLRPFLQQLHSIQIKQPDKNNFLPCCGRRLAGANLPPMDLLASVPDDELRLSLMDLEHWALKSLNSWATRNKDEESSFIKLSSVINWYISEAVSTYAGSPEDFSVMVLTLMHLWTVLDTAATLRYPLLKKFDSGFSTELFESLLLPKRNQMVQLRDIEKYLAKRNETCLAQNPSVFGDISWPLSFGAQYFDQSAMHKDLKIAIEKEAAIEVELKKEELSKLHAKYSKLMSESNESECTNTLQWRGRGRRRVQKMMHDPNCLKHGLINKAQALKISLHEWPLPSSEPAAKSVVFELDIPDLFRSWRATTYRIIADVLNPTPPTQVKRRTISLTNHTDLSRHLKSKTDRIDLASYSKTLAQTGQATQAVMEATNFSVCRPSNLKFFILDVKSQHPAIEHLIKHDILDRCTFQLPPGCYKPLQYFVSHTTHTPNQVIAKQSSCPDGLTVHEAHAFAILRSGHRLQWLNIARELVTRALDFGKEEVHLLLLQASCQAGPSALQQVSRDSHIELEEEGFGKDLLSALTSGLISVESNWQGSVAALTFIILSSRLLSVSLHNTVRQKCLRFLQRARDVTIGWLRDVVKILHETTDDGEMSYLTHQGLDLALICHCTFDMDSRQLPDLLSSTDNVAILVEIAIIIKDRWPVSEEPLTNLTRELLRRFSRTSHAMENALKHRIAASPDGINVALRKIWAGYEAGAPWFMMDAPNDRWLTTRTADSENVSSMDVQFNVLTGALLINGLPLGRLPAEYESHPTYKRIFGNKILGVIPSSKNMYFETRNSIHGHQVHFAIHDEELIIRASQGHELYELIPLHVLENDFPHTFVQNYVHWVHRGNMALEWRPLENKWLSSSENWHISKPEDPIASYLESKSRRLVDFRSPTAEGVYLWLEPLETAPNINIYYNVETKETEICLPRMNLDFILRRTGLESKQFRGMVIDEHQFLGCFFGLKSKLILKSLSGASKIVIVPHGNVSFRKVDHHVRVSINPGTSDKVPYHHFAIDKDLGRLVDNGNLKSRLFKLYLHAVTSYCLPDPLTSRSGTEEALHGLRLGSTRSFLALDEDNLEQLSLFTKLTPARDFYPKGSKFMQTVNWEPLSALSHHEDFLTEVRLLVSQAASLRVFQSNSDMKYKLDQRGSPELRERAAVRNAFYRVHPFGAERSTPTLDVMYAEARDAVATSSIELGSCYISTMVEKWTCRLDPIKNLFQQLQSWGLIFNGPQQDFKFELDKKWLENPAYFVPYYWCSIHALLSKIDPNKDRFRVTVALTNLAQSQHDNMRLVHTLLALATAPGLRNVKPPAYARYDLSKGFEPDRPRLNDILEMCGVSFENSPEKKMARLLNETDFDLHNRREAAYQAATKLQVKKCLNDLVRQWPTKAIAFPNTTEVKTYIPDLENRKGTIRALFEDWYQNHEFKNYIEEIQVILESLPHASPMPERYPMQPQRDFYKEKRSYIKIDDLLESSPPKLPLSGDDLQDLVAMNNRASINKEAPKLKTLLTKLSRCANDHYQKMYIKDLLKSHTALLAESQYQSKLAQKSPQNILQDHLDRCKEKVGLVYNKIFTKLIVSRNFIFDSARYASLLPRLSPSILLRLLARLSTVGLSVDWRVALIRYGLVLASMQRAERLVACGTREPELLSEITNRGHDNWDPVEFPEWLLLELESNIFIRPEQAQIALEMITPRSGLNSIMQLNMGLGKSSVIVPIVAATLADQTKLARVVVLKSLSEQMFQLLVSKLGGLIGRRIYRLPITRALAPSLQTAIAIQNLFKECMACGGILLIEPETLLSFELLGIEHLLSHELNVPEIEMSSVPLVDLTETPHSLHKVGKVMVQTQKWLYENARDILDESDEILSVKFELIYTLGIQQNIEFSPERWCIIQRVLGVLSEVAQNLSKEFPHGLEVFEAVPGAFPRIRMLQERAGKVLLEKVAQSICQSGLPSLAIWRFNQEERNVILEYITNVKISKARAEILESRVFVTEFTKLSLLLLRGLFAAGVLEFIFTKKRWRVNYGLDISRSMLAVPYHAKDNPSARSEFGHPDTAIALTCLSYYYGGLTDEQIYSSFEELLLSDHANEHYVQWIRFCENLPSSFKQLTGVNLRDRHQCRHELFPLIRQSKVLIDYYLEHLVFPKEMKEFPNKLSSSGWEIAREKTHPTTGFSGTNDSKYMLPTPINQCELSEQVSTNAEVLACLLHPDNSFDTQYTLQMEVLDAAAVMHVAVAMDPPIRVILDVGAQLLDDNEKIATSWLGMVAPRDAQAVIFFHDNDIYVLNREGMKEPLLVSPFAKQMDQCLVYLDEAHTRGTDLKMPANYRAIVTLGPDLTKDRLAQACKRLRKLGKGQSVVFCASLEVQSKILRCSGKKDPKFIEVEDVLLWAMRNSWDFTKKGMPLWATQGMRHYRRRAACDLSGEITRIPVEILEPEALTLSERYGLDRQMAGEGIVCRNRLQVDNNVTRAEICSIRSKCREFGLTSFDNSDLHEEQERELQPENEREQQVEAPLRTTPYEHNLHAAIKQLVLTGNLNPYEGHTQAFKAFDFTRARDKLNLGDWPENLLMSEDFALTVQLPNEGNKDSFLRPVNWIISFQNGNRETKYLILSPFEAHELLPFMRGQDRVRLHVYSPRLSLSNRSLEDLSFCAVPPVPEDWVVPAVSTPLNLFAGQLYLRDVADYRTLCRFLGVRFQDLFRGVNVSTDGFISPQTRRMQDEETAAICKFTQSPIDFLRLVTTFRRLGQTFATSHMGKILNGELVRSYDFEVIERAQEVDDAMDVDEQGPRIKEEPGLFVN